MMNYDMTKSLKTLAYEEDVFCAITDDMVATAETVEDVINALDELLPESIPYACIETVAKECYYEYYLAKV